MINRLQKMLNKIISKTIIDLLNFTLKDNLGSVELFKNHANKSLVIKMIGVDFAFLITADGLFSNIINSQQPFDVEIYIPISIISYAIDHDQIKAFQKIQMVGDNALGRNILEVLSNLHFSGLYKTTNPLAGMAIRQFISLLNAFKSQILLMGGNFGHSIAEYLQYEKHLIVSNYEIINFCDDVDELKSRTELLIKRFELLLKNRDGS